MIKNKYCLWSEGKIDECIFNNFKNLILENKTSRCKVEGHCYTFHGTKTLDKIAKKSSINWDCYRIIIIDKDEINDNEINKMKKYSNNQCNNTLIIISNPCIEIILYAIFNATEANLTKEVIYKKLNDYLKSYFNLEYKKKNDVIEKIFLNVRNDQNLIKQWFKNLKKLYELGYSNFYEIIKKFKSTKSKRI